MSWDDYKVKIIERIIDNEAQHELIGNVVVKVPKSSKYKKSNKKGKDLPDLDVGKLVVVRIDKKKSKGYGHEVKGYLQCQLLDWHDEHRWWNESTRMILQVMKSSHEDLDDLVGRLISGTYGSPNSYWSHSHYSVVSFDRDFVKWR